MHNVKSMKTAKPCRLKLSENFYGSSTLGDRGQIVIPVEARNDLGFKPGDKLLIMRHPIHDAITICTLESFQELANDFANEVALIEAKQLAEDKLA
jgi:AbrB family looped-hinge helix DNA binding protein